MVASACGDESGCCPSGDWSYVLVRGPRGSAADGGELFELSINAYNGPLALRYLERAFPGAYGLKYKNPATGFYRIVLYVHSLTSLFALSIHLTLS